MIFAILVDICMKFDPRSYLVPETLRIKKLFVTDQAVALSNSVSCAASWFAVQVRPRHEKAVASIIRSKGYEEFLPLYLDSHRWSDRIKQIGFPLFEGYVFCSLDPFYRLRILTIPGVIQFVGAGKIPIAVDAGEIDALRVACNSGLSTMPWPFLELGSRVRIDGGPLEDLEGILVQFRGSHRLVISIGLLQRSVAVEVERDWVTPVPGSRFHRREPQFRHSANSI